MKNVKWTKEKVFETAKKYKYKIDFQHNDNSAYNTALRKGWIQEMTFFERKQNPYIDKLDNVYCYKFEELKSIYVGRTIHPITRDASHKNDSNSSVYKFAEEHNIEIPEMEILESGLTLEQGLELEDFYINKFRNEGWNLLNKAKTGVGSGSLGGCVKKWTYEKCYDTAKKYKYKNDFIKNEKSGAYKAALKNGWLKDYIWLKYKKQSNKIKQYSLNGEFLKEWSNAVEIEKILKFNQNNIRSCCINKQKTAYGYVWKYSNIENKYKNYIRKWSKEKVYETAKKYKYKIDFRKYDNSAYQTARKNNWLIEMTWFEKKKIKKKTPQNQPKEIMEEERFANFADRSVKSTDRPKQICSANFADQNLLTENKGTNVEEAVTQFGGAVIPQVNNVDEYVQKCKKN